MAETGFERLAKVGSILSDFSKNKRTGTVRVMFTEGGIQSVITEKKEL